MNQIINKQSYFLVLYDTYLETDINVLAKNNKELSDITKHLTSRYLVVSITPTVNLLEGYNFLDDLRMQNKPDGMEFGNG